MDIPESMIGHKCDIAQYNMLRRCSEKYDITEWNEWRNQNPDEEIWLQGANLERFHLKGANLRGANLQGANLFGANLRQAILVEAHLECANCALTHFDDANCLGAHFDGTNCLLASFDGAECKRAYFNGANCLLTCFEKANCESASFNDAVCTETFFDGTNCRFTHFDNANFTQAFMRNTNLTGSTCTGASFVSAVFNSDTIFAECEIDEDTDFSNTNLASVVIEDATRTRLERNIRQKNWDAWCTEKEKAVATYFDGLLPLVKVQSPLLKSLTRALLLLCLPISLVRFFWYLSDYGYSTTRIIAWFFISITFFTALYTLFPWMLALGSDPLQPQGLAGYLRHVVQMFMFATSTMVTLGFSNINVATQGGPNFWGMIVVTTNLMVGYFMLAVLVTRLAILFQTLGPGLVLPKTKKKNKSEKSQRK